MIPEISTQLNAVIRSLDTIIKPCLEGSNPLALEQINLCIKTLEMVNLRYPYLDKYLRSDIEANIQLGRELLALNNKATDDNANQRLDSTVKKSQAIISSSETGLLELQAIVQELREELTEWIKLSNAQGFNKDVNRLVLAQAEAMVLKGRSWNVLLGFEQHAEKLPKIESLLSGTQIKGC